MKADPPRVKMDKIEFLLDEEDQSKTGWYINTYAKIGDLPTDSVGPYETKTEALRMWRETTGPNTKEPSDAGHQD